MSEQIALESLNVHWSALPNNTAKNWWQDAGLRRCILNVILLYASIVAYGYDGAFISGVQGLPLWGTYFGHPAGIKLGLITSSYLIPQLPFAYLGSWLSDRYGRKAVIFVASLIGVLGPLVSGFGKNLAAFCAGRVITGISTSFYQVVTPPLIAEIAHPRFRAAASGSTYCIYAVGALVCGWIGFGMAHWHSNWAWRVLTFLQCFGSLPLLVCSVTPLMVESPRWLVKQERPEEALAILAKLHANGDLTDPLVQYELQEITGAINNDILGRQWQFKNWFTTPGNRRRFATLIYFGWSISMAGSNVIAYYFPSVLRVLGYTNAVQVEGMLAGDFGVLLVFGLAGAQLADRIGRRKLVLFSSTLTAITLTIFTALMAVFVNRGGKAVAGASLSMLYLHAGLYVFGYWPLTFLYLPEILPFHMRTQGMATFSLFANLGALYSALLTPIALAGIGWKYFLVFAVGNYVMIVAAYFLILETKGLSLEEIAILFDGDDAALVRAQHSVKADAMNEEDKTVDQQFELTQLPA